MISIDQVCSKQQKP